MNINGIARSNMARNKGVEDFLLHVANVIEKPLKEWNKNFDEIIV